MEPYPSGVFGFINDPDCQFGNGSVWTRTRIRSDGPEPLLTLCSGGYLPLLRTRCSVDVFFIISIVDSDRDLVAV